jgi:hypothetical protein
MPHKDKQASKIKGKVLTVNDLLTPADIKEALDILNEKRLNFQSLIAIYVNKDGSFGWVTTNDVTNAHFIYYMEQMKHSILTDPNEDEEEEAGS